MTALNYNALIASFPDNNLKAILPSNMRDLVDSIMLAYDNVVVVKPTQPTGNAFPTPVAGVITLAVNTLYLINGSVTVYGKLKYPASSNTTISSISGNPNLDKLNLDSTITSSSLIYGAAGDTISGRLLNLGLKASAASSQIFDMAATVDFTIYGNIFDSSKMGTWAGSTGSTFFSFNRTKSVTSALTLTSTFANTRFIDFSTGSTAETVDVVDFSTSVHTDLRIENSSYTMASGKFLFKGLATGSFTKGKMLNCTKRNANVGNIAPTALSAATNIFFHGNEEYTDSSSVTYSYGGLVFSGNSTSTVSTGAGNFIKIVSNSTDVLLPQTTGFTRSATMQLTLTGASGTYWFAANCPIRRASGSSGQAYQLEIFVNGTAVSTSSQVTRNQAYVYNVADAYGLSGFLTLVTNDVLELRVASQSTSVDSVTESCTWTVGYM